MPIIFSTFVSLPSDMIEAPDNLNNLHPICMAYAFSAGSAGCPFRLNAASPVRRTPGVFTGPFPFAIEGEFEFFFAPTLPVVKLSKSDLPDTLETSDSPCISSASH